MRQLDPKDLTIKVDVRNLYSFLDAVPLPITVLDPVFDNEGGISDFIFSHLNSPAAESLNLPIEKIAGESITSSSLNVDFFNLFEGLKKTYTEESFFLSSEPNEGNNSHQAVNIFKLDSKILVQWKTAEKVNEQSKTIALLQNSNKELEQFAYIASHDLQEPIRMVMSFTQLLQKRYADKLDDDANEYIYYAVDGAKRMKELIDKLLEYSRVSTEKRKWKEIPVKTVIKNILEDYEVTLAETNIKITSGDMPVIVSDESLLSRVFSNLISNAVKYRADKDPEINLAAAENETEWIFSVADNGIGIEKDYYEKIFLMFQRLHGKTKYPGMGMGLAICKRIVDTLGGRIWLESESDKGTTFYFTIPKKGV